MDDPVDVQPTFRGFVATTVDAAYLVEAAVLARTLPLFEDTPSQPVLDV
jgi:hypothetical protein